MKLSTKNLIDFYENSTIQSLLDSICNTGISGYLADSNDSSNTLVTTLVLDKEPDSFDVVRESDTNGFYYKLTVRDKQTNKQIKTYIMNNVYQYKVFYKEGVLVIRFDKNKPKPTEQLVKVDF